jgi:DNA-binding CsgD family transcriptional regulator
METLGASASNFDKCPRIERNFVGAIRIANWIKRNNWCVSTGDIINVSEGCVWPAFKNAVQKHHGKKIELHFRDDLNFTSFSLVKGDPAEFFEILIPSAFNFCHRRFAICKELCHIFTDDNSVRTHDPVATLNHALQTAISVQNPRRESELSPLFTYVEISSEDFCFLLALEILIPIKDRNRIITESLVEGISNYDIAVRLRIPEKLVKFYIASSYNTAFKRVHGPEK